MSNERLNQYNHCSDEHPGLLPLQVYYCNDGSEFKTIALSVADGFKVLYEEKPGIASRWVKQTWVDRKKAYLLTFGDFKSEIRRTTLRGI